MSNATTVADLLEQMANCFIVEDGVLNVREGAAAIARQAIIEQTQGKDIYLDPQNCFPPLLPGAHYRVLTYTPAGFPDHIVVRTDKETGEFALSIPQFINAFHDAELNGLETA